MMVDKFGVEIVKGKLVIVGARDSLFVCRVNCVFGTFIDVTFESNGESMYVKPKQILSLEPYKSTNPELFI